MEWDSLQVVTSGLTLKELLHPKFLECLNEEFDGKNIDVIDIKLKVSNPNIDEFENFELITLFTRNLKDLMLNQIVVDVENPKNLNKVKSAIESWED